MFRRAAGEGDGAEWSVPTSQTRKWQVRADDPHPHSLTLHCGDRGLEVTCPGSHECHESTAPNQSPGPQNYTLSRTPQLPERSVQYFTGPISSLFWEKKPRVWLRPRSHLVWRSGTAVFPWGLGLPDRQNLGSGAGADLKLGSIFGTCFLPESSCPFCPLGQKPCRLLCPTWSFPRTRSSGRVGDSGYFSPGTAEAGGGVLSPTWPPPHTQTTVPVGCCGWGGGEWALCMALHPEFSN